MLTKRLFIYLLLASSLLCNGWIWFISPNPPRLDKVVLKYPIGDQKLSTASAQMAAARPSGSVTDII